jgi:hypothetical protein
MVEIAEKMLNEDNYFSMIDMDENPTTLENRFIKLGFHPKQGYLHKKQLSFVKDYLNYYIVILISRHIFSL